MWLTFDKCSDYEIWDEKPNFKAEDGIFINKRGDNSPVWVFCQKEFEKALPRLKLRAAEIRQIKVMPVGRKQKAK